MSSEKLIPDHHSSTDTPSQREIQLDLFDSAPLKLAIDEESFTAEQLRLQTQQFLRAQRSLRVWKVLTLISTMIGILLVLTTGLVVAFSRNPTFINDFMRWTVDMTPVASQPFKAIPSVAQLNRGKPVLPIHSHNDYWRKTPLFDALELGIQSVEADVWSLRDDEDMLYVGHRVFSLTQYNSLERLYTGPLLELLNSINPDLTSTSSRQGVFDSDPSKTLYLYIDVKNNPEMVFAKLESHLKPFLERGYLTTYSTTDKQWYHGPITVIVSGEVPVEQISSMSLRTMFIDSPLDDFTQLEEKLHELNNTDPLSTISIMSSASLKKITNSKGMTQGGLTLEERASVKEAIENAHSLGIRTRIWETPSWPLEQRDKVWRDLMNLGIDMINADDLLGAVSL